jgi:hypothetical protein
MLYETKSPITEHGVTAIDDLFKFLSSVELGELLTCKTAMATHFLVNVCTLNITQVLCLHSLGDLIAYLCLFVCFVLFCMQTNWTSGCKTQHSLLWNLPHGFASD